MRILSIFLCFLSLVFISSCNGDKKEPVFYEEKVELNDQEGFREMKIEIIEDKTIKKNRYGDLSVSVRHISALEFIEKTGRKIDSIDIDALLQESVFIMDFKSLTQKHRNPLNLKQCNVSFEEGVKFMAFEIEKRLKIIQEDSVYHSNGVHFERDFSLSDRLRVVAFFKGVNREKEFTYFFDDKIFGGGVQEFNFSNFEMYTENS